VSGEQSASSLWYWCLCIAGTEGIVLQRALRRESPSSQGWGGLCQEWTSSLLDEQDAAWMSVKRCKTIALGVIEELTKLWGHSLKNRGDTSDGAPAAPKTSSLVTRACRSERTRKRALSHT
jgi:hypothetical protein